MLTIDFAPPPGSIYRILCLGAHCDDIEIGCGGALLKLIQQYKQIECYWVVFSSNQQRAQEAYKSASCFLGDIEKKQIEVQQFRDGFLPYDGTAVKEQFEQIKQAFVPDIIFTHYRHDLHQDHRLIAELTWNTFRNHLILEYEIPKYDGDLGSPNVFFQLDQALCDQKINYILESFPSQHSKHWFSKETFLALLRLRGMESASPGNYAEGFYCRKIVC